MNFNENQVKAIYEFVMNYNTNEEIKNSVQETYNNNVYKLSMLQIYALEEILRYGSKGIFNRFLETKGAYSDEQAIDLYDEFVKLLSEDISFKQYKMHQLKELPETLSAMEMFAFTLISDSNNQKEQIPEDKKEKKEEKQKELEYDSFNPILYSTDNQIRETLENLFFGELIHQMLEVPAMLPIKNRQKENGRIANIDKPLIIKKIQDFISFNNSMAQFKQAVDTRYVQAKMNILLGKGKLAFEPYLKYNTNISSSEILGINRSNSEKDVYNSFMDMLNEKRNNFGKDYSSFVEMFKEMKEQYDEKKRR